jgi:hypothetical protein
MLIHERGMSPKTYAIYTRCDHCGVYDRDPNWCDLCAKPKTAQPRQGAAGRPLRRLSHPAAVKQCK